MKNFCGQALALDNLSSPAHPKRPCALTVGNFDGVHLGHQRLLREMRELVGSSGSVCVITFSNHSSQVFPSKKAVEIILSKELKLKWLGEFGADIIYCVEFTTALANLEYDVFLRGMMKACPFDFLVLGEGAKLGKGLQGTPEKIKELGKSLNFEAKYLSKATFGDEAVSSERIRHCIKNHDIKTAEKLLGHPLEGKF